MSTAAKILLFRCVLFFTYPVSLLILWPLAQLRKKKNAKYFFFFDRFELGGGQKVHIDILQSLAHEKKVVYFTRNSRNNILKEAFYSIPNTECHDIHPLCQNLLLRIWSVHYFSFFINRHAGILFAANSTFFYDLLFFLRRKKFQIVELLHSFAFAKNGMEYFGLYYYSFFQYRMVGDLSTKEQIEKQYKTKNIPDYYNTKIIMIEPGIKIPFPYTKPAPLPLKLLYAGRAGHPKRVYLIDKIAQKCYKENLPVIFSFAGPVEEELSDEVRTKGIIYGSIKKQDELYQIYAANHIVLIMSSFEGFPMAIKEGMANGCIPLSTALNGIKTHLTHLKNALLVNEIEKEEVVVQQAFEQINYLLSHQTEMLRLSEAAHHYAQHYFSDSLFKEKLQLFFKNLQA